jgi:hypothetical protein
VLQNCGAHLGVSKLIGLLGFVLFLFVAPGAYAILVPPVLAKTTAARAAPRPPTPATSSPSTIIIAGQCPVPDS